MTLELLTGRIVGCYETNEKQEPMAAKGRANAWVVSCAVEASRSGHRQRGSQSHPSLIQKKAVSARWAGCQESIIKEPCILSKVLRNAFPN